MSNSFNTSPCFVEKPLDSSLREYIDTNSDIVTRITKPVSIDDIGALSAQSDQPILFENIVEKPGFRLCDILVKNRRSQTRALAVKRTRRRQPRSAHCVHRAAGSVARMQRQRNPGMSHL